MGNKILGWPPSVWAILFSLGLALLAYAIYLIRQGKLKIRVAPDGSLAFVLVWGKVLLYSMTSVAALMLSLVFSQIVLDQGESSAHDSILFITLLGFAWFFFFWYLCGKTIWDYCNKLQRSMGPATEGS